MSNGKTIEAFGISSIYHSSPLVFLNRISLAFGYNIKACFFDSSSYNKASEYLTIENGFKDLLEVSMDIDRKFEDTYFIELAIRNGEKIFDINFYPNNIVSVCHIPFHNRWRYFIEDILDRSGGYHKSWKNYQKKIELIRDLYIPIFKKLRSNKVILSTDANHLWEVELVYNASVKKKVVLEDILNCAKEKDNINFYNLKRVFEGEHYDEINKFHNTNECYKIAFIDEF